MSERAPKNNREPEISKEVWSEKKTKEMIINTINQLQDLLKRKKELQKLINEHRDKGEINQMLSNTIELKGINDMIEKITEELKNDN